MERKQNSATDSSGKTQHVDSNPSSKSKSKGTSTSKSKSKSSYHGELLSEENSSSNREHEENKSIDEESKDRNRNDSKFIKLINNHSNKAEINKLSDITWKDTKPIRLTNIYAKIKSELLQKNSCNVSEEIKAATLSLLEYEDICDQYMDKDNDIKIDLRKEAGINLIKNLSKVKLPKLHGIKLMNISANKSLIKTFIDSLVPHYPTDSSHQNEEVPITRFHFNYESELSKYVEFEKFKNCLMDLSVHITRRLTFYKLEFECQEFCWMLTSSRNTEVVAFKNCKLYGYTDNCKIENVEQSKIRELTIEGFVEDPESENTHAENLETIIKAISDCRELIYELKKLKFKNNGIDVNSAEELMNKYKIKKINTHIDIQCID